MRCASLSSGQSPMEPQYTTADIPCAISDVALRTSAGTSGVRSGLQGVMSAGITPEKICAAMPPSL